MSNSCRSGFRSITSVGTPDDDLTKVSRWMAKTEEAENVAQSISVQSVHPQISVPTPVVTLISTHGGKCFAQVRELKPSVQPTIFRDAASEVLEWTEQRLS